MSSAVAELDGYLQSMLSLRPPGVSGSKINSITSLCTANVQSESVLVQKIYTHFKRAPGTHKLGVLYVVDSVTRQWVESARKAGQSIGGTAPDGTFAAGVTRVTELLPVLMTDIIKNAPEDQKEKIKKLVDIWERGYTFPSNMLATFKEKLNAPASNNIESTTPEGSPAPNYIPLGQGQGQNGQTQPPQAPSAQPQAAPDTSSILKALADMAKQNTSSAPAGSGVPAHTSSNNVLNTQNAVSQPMPSSVDQATAVSGGQAVNPYAGNLATHLAGLNVPQNMGAGQTQSQTPPNPLAAVQSNPLAALLSQQQQQPQQQQQHHQQHHQQPQQSQQAPGIGPEALQQVQLLQLLAAQGVPQDQWATALQILSLSNNPNTGMPNMNAGAVPGFPQGTPPAAPAAAAAAAGSNAWGGRDVPSRDRDRDADYMRSPQGQYRRRSRSPGWDRRRNESPPRRRDSPVYGEYNADSPGRNRADPREARGRRGGGHEYRQRSPPGRRRRSPSPPRKETSLPPAGPKVIEWDYTIGPGNIKVLSRTLFVGGVTTSEAYLRSIFAKFGTVQTCIVNIDKRHAFVKMINRKDAISAREGMEQYKTGEMQLRTRWGVGFGPRDCSDYQTGISIIPIERLTDADRKWMLSAEYGGTGGKPIEAGMVVEEPDIEIGAGVSSKAISRRMATDQGGKRGPQSTRTNPGPERFRRPDRGGMDGHDHHGQHDRAGSANPQNANTNNNSSNNNNNGIGVPPAVPGFGFSFPGMPLFPPGFMLGQQQQQQGGSSSSTPAQPPPPGQGS